ncbi:hypothetical protein ALO86_200253 [Pseudomonas syringae pv. berberidis]|nr:hypothetical protein ALO86_200253 [Pseudomonas syringae pv. berberidis]
MLALLQRQKLNVWLMKQRLQRPNAWLMRQRLQKPNAWLMKQQLRKPNALPKSRLVLLQRPFGQLIHSVRLARFQLPLPLS